MEETADPRRAKAEHSDTDEAEVDTDKAEINKGSEHKGAKKGGVYTVCCTPQCMATVLEAKVDRT